MKSINFALAFIFVVQVFGSEYVYKTTEEVEMVAEKLPVVLPKSYDKVIEKHDPSSNQDQYDLYKSGIEFTSNLISSLSSGFQNFQNMLPNIDVSQFLAPRKPIIKYMSMKRYSWERGYNLNIFYDLVNNLPVVSERSEYEAKLLGQSDEFRDQLFLSVRDGENEHRDRNEMELYNLNSKLFESAVSTLNVARLNELFAKRKHFLLKSTDKAGVFKHALLACRSAHNADICSLIFKKLLENGFYSENNEFPWISTSLDTKYPFYEVIQIPSLCKLLLNYDKEIFAKQKSNYISEFIRRHNYKVALEAFYLGFDPKIEEKGRNALDEALDVSLANLTADERINLQTLINGFYSDYKMEISNTGGNLAALCEKGFWERAIELIKKGNMKFDRLSPIGISIRWVNLEVFNVAVENYLDKLSAEQLKFDLEEARYYASEKFFEKVKEHLEKLERIA